MSILVAGGAGYIGSHMVKDLIENGEDVVVADNLSTGHRDAINPKAKFYEGDIRDRQFLDKIFDNEDITAVVHFAAFSIVPESMSKPNLKMLLILEMVSGKLMKTEYLKIIIGEEVVMAKWLWIEHWR